MCIFNYSEELYSSSLIFHNDTSAKT